MSRGKSGRRGRRRRGMSEVVKLFLGEADIAEMSKAAAATSRGDRNRFGLAAIARRSVNGVLVIPAKSTGARRACPVESALQRRETT